MRDYEFILIVNGLQENMLMVALAAWFSHLLPRSFFKVPPYLGLVPIRSIISGIQLAKMAYTRTVCTRVVMA